MILLIILAIVSVIAISAHVILNQKKFGRLPQGERLERVLKSPNFRNGQFQNLQVTPTMTTHHGKGKSMMDFLFKKSNDRRPDSEIRVIKTDLHKLNPNENVLVWFGHSSYLMQIDGKRFLVDPVFYDASPFSFFNKAFKGTNVFKPSDMPDIDYLIISHDHWDHLDYKTVVEMKEHTRFVICALGVGEHFEHWGFDKNQIIEMDWNEKTIIEEGFSVDCLPARHFSGRGLKRNQSLWASFMLQTPSQTVFIGGDGGYGTHFAKIGKQFSNIDLAILENGQYNEDWRYIHTMPEFLEQEVQDLHAKRVITVHHSKYSLANHPWDEPLETEKKLLNDSINITIPTIGEVVELKH